MNLFRDYINEERTTLNESIEDAAYLLKGIGRALSKTERMRLWTYFAKWKALKYRELIDGIYAESYLYDGADGDPEPDRQKEDEIPF